MTNTLKDLLQISSIEDLDPQGQTEFIGQLIDTAFDEGSKEGALHAIDLCSQTVIDALPPLFATRMYYYLGNAWSDLKRLYAAETSNPWEFYSETHINELKNLRLAIRSEGFDKSPARLKCQIFTNIGNSLSNLGRISEAVDQWEKAMEIDKAFSMAIGNLGYGIFHYGRALYDKGHIPIMFQCSSHFLTKALENSSSLEPQAYKQFEALVGLLTTVLPSDVLGKLPVFANFDWGSTQEEASYRRWCAENKLFLNPLNDISKESIVAHDCICLPSFVLPIVEAFSYEAPLYIDFFNQIKQEFVSARYQIYEAQIPGNVHFSDKGVLLLNSLKYNNHYFSLEKYKMGFRALYSVFDKIALFLLNYLKISHKGHTDLRSIWYEKSGKSLKPEFQTRKNWTMRGLFWLSKDLFQAESDDQLLADPDAQNISLLRKYIEHRFVVIIDYAEEGRKFEKDEFCLRISASYFSELSMLLTKLVRNAIIYLLLGMHEEETLNNKESFSAPIQLDVIDDEWKR